MSWMTQLTLLGASFPVSQEVGSHISLSKDVFLFLSVSTMLTLQITLKLDQSIVIMSIPVSQLTVEQAHKEFSSLADKIAAKYE